MLQEEKVRTVLQRLALAYPDAKPGLNFHTPFELLIATILSAQCTDVRVNQVTPALFAAYPDAKAMHTCPEEELIGYIRTCGMYRTKAKNIKKTCEILTQRYDGQVPSQREALEALPGVGRKTANVVLSNAFGVPAIAVDTHVFRVSNRIGLADAPNVEKTEEQLMAAIPQDTWSIAHHWLIWHGRRVCTARKPDCAACSLRDICQDYEKRTAQTQAQDAV
jgi:endonuclease-3